MKLRLWQVDAFASRVFEGNPAAVALLDEWLEDATMQAIAQENNLAETAFFVRHGRSDFDLRWFTPAVEVPLCGHATLASAWVIFRDIAPELDAVQFATRSGRLTVENAADGCHRMSLPAAGWAPFAGPDDFAVSLGHALGVAPPAELHLAPSGAGGMTGVIGIWPEGDVRVMALSGAVLPMLAGLGAGGLLATAKGDGRPYDFVSRFFAPGMGVPEDPVTGSMHATLTPFWAERLGKTELRAFQASRRGGELHCTTGNGRVILSGPCALYLKGEIHI